jgi:hypothetical protein
VRAGVLLLTTKNAACRGEAPKERRLKGRERGLLLPFVASFVVSFVVRAGVLFFSRPATPRDAEAQRTTARGFELASGYRLFGCSCDCVASQPTYGNSPGAIVPAPRARRGRAPSFNSQAWRGGGEHSFGCALDAAASGGAVERWCDGQQCPASQLKQPAKLPPANTRSSAPLRPPHRGRVNLEVYPPSVWRAKPKAKTGGRNDSTPVRLRCHAPA